MAAKQERPTSRLAMTSGHHKQTNYFAHTLMRARDWQHRSEFDQVRDWWRAGGLGVRALVGAGKTAIAERFLNELPVRWVSNPSSSTTAAVPPPHSIFVYSFYDDDKPALSRSGAQ
jgi:hypothetical protein